MRETLILTRLSQVSFLYCHNIRSQLWNRESFCGRGDCPLITVLNGGSRKLGCTQIKVQFRGKPGANARMGVCTPILFIAIATGVAAECMPQAKT